jgi:hypothetical protein
VHNLLHQATTQQVPLQQATLHASTKRQVLGTNASIFYSLGVLSQLVILYKAFLQKLWQDLIWDEQLTHLRKEEWNQLINTLPKLSQIHITRKIICAQTTTVHIRRFYASETAFGACIYITSQISSFQSTITFIKRCPTEKTNKP